MIPFTLEKLDELLGSKKISGALIAVTFLIFFFSLNYILFIISLAVFLFTIYMLSVLYRYKKFGWITAFVILMSGSFILSLFSEQGSTMSVIVSYLPLLSFFLYCTILKVQVREWVLELEYERDIRRQKAIEEYWN
jgi:hypothetical protein